MHLTLAHYRAAIYWQSSETTELLPKETLIPWGESEVQYKRDGGVFWGLVL